MTKKTVRKNSSRNSHPLSPLPSEIGPFLLSPRLWPRKRKRKRKQRKLKHEILQLAENETSPTLAGPSQTTQNHLLADSSKPPALYDEVAGVAEEAEEAEGAMTLMTTPTPLPLRLQTENSMEKSQRFLPEIER